MLIAVEGCCHGELDRIYDTLDLIAREHGRKVDLLVCCGDFQAVRNVYDLSCMAVPPKYLSINTFYKYYSGEKVAPVPTVFIGGNHEASNHLQELAYGGWVAPNIYYLGNAGVINFGGLRIAGVSGIYKGCDYLRGHCEVPPFDENTKRSIYHVRQLEIFRLKQISRPVDLFISHDWPLGVTDHGDIDNLLYHKPYFKDDLDRGQLGNPATWEVLQKVKPRYWFSAHLHAKFSALIKHEGENGGETRFLALDKCLPHKRFLQILDVPATTESGGQLAFSFDPEWLGILKDTDHLWHFEPTIYYLPGPGSSERHDFTQTDDDCAKTSAALGDSLTVDPASFQRVAPAHESTWGEGTLDQIVRYMEQIGIPTPPVRSYPNPQTAYICEKIGVRDPLVELTKIAETNADKLKLTSDLAGPGSNSGGMESTDEVREDAGVNGETEGEQLAESGAKAEEEQLAEGGTKTDVEASDSVENGNHEDEPLTKKMKMENETEVVE